VEGQVKKPQNAEQRTGIPVRVGCGLIIALTMLCSVLVVAIVNLAINGEIDARGQDLEGIRIWMVWGDGPLPRSDF
jgi:hypothetical protein